MLREEKLQLVKKENIVPGDIVSIATGERIPCDMVIFKNNGDLKIDMEEITGSNEPVVVDLTLEEQPSNIMAAKNVAFAGSKCVEGCGQGICIKTGSNTVIECIMRNPG